LHAGYVWMHEHVILNAFPLQQWLHERTSMLCYTYIFCLFLKTELKFRPTNLTSGCIEDLIRTFSLMHDKDNSFLFRRPWLREENLTSTLGIRLTASVFWPVSENLSSCDCSKCSCRTRRKWQCPTPGSIPPTYGRNSIEWQWLVGNGWGIDENGHN
jgi:hypothetical protein